MQEEAFGGLAHNTRQRLEAIGAKHSKIKLRARPRDTNFAPGTVLLREWGMPDGLSDGETPAAGPGIGRTSCSALVVAWDMPRIVLHVPPWRNGLTSGRSPRGTAL